MTTNSVAKKPRLKAPRLEADLTPAPTVEQLPAGVQMAQGLDGTRDVVRLDEAKKDAFTDCGGSKSQAFNVTMFREVLGCLWVSNAKVDDAATTRMMLAANAAMKSFKPADEIEGMIAAQAVALHFTAMECLRRANIAEQPFEIAARLRKDAANMMRTMTDMLEALDRKRGKGPQVVRVERVVVHEGGQAIVGNVAPRGEV